MFLNLLPTVLNRLCCPLLLTVRLLTLLTATNSALSLFVSPQVLSSVHVRCVDMEMSCRPKDPMNKDEFEKNTRAASQSLMLYMASVDHEWAKLPNHERISDQSFRVLQARTFLRAFLDIALDSLIAAAHPNCAAFDTCRMRTG